MSSRTVKVRSIGERTSGTDNRTAAGASSDNAGSSETFNKYDGLKAESQCQRELEKQTSGAQSASIVTEMSKSYERMDSAFEMASSGDLWGREDSSTAARPCDTVEELRVAPGHRALMLAGTGVTSSPKHRCVASEASEPSVQYYLTFAQAIATSEAGDVPMSLRRLLAPYRTHLQEVKVLGRGGFGEVVLAVNTLDNRVMAVKKVQFDSPVYPWEDSLLLESTHERILREVRALSALQDCAQIVSYHTCWIEPDWRQLARRLRTIHAPSASYTHDYTHDDDDAPPALHKTGFPAADPPAPAPACVIESVDTESPSDSEEPAPFRPLFGRRVHSLENNKFWGRSVSSSDDGYLSNATDTEEVDLRRHSYNMSGSSVTGGAPQRTEFLCPRSNSNCSWTSAGGTDEVEHRRHSGVSRRSSGILLRREFSFPTDASTCTLGSGMEAEAPSGDATDADRFGFDPQKPCPYILYMSMEHVEGVTLDVWLRNRNMAGQLLSLDADLAIFRDVVSALAFMHGKGFLHRDLKPANVFVATGPDGGVRAKVGDFGLSVQASSNHEGLSVLDGAMDGAAGLLSGHSQSHTSGVGTHTYCAPEQLSGSGVYGSAVDMFSLGLILIELLCVFSTGMERAECLMAARKGRLPEGVVLNYPAAAPLIESLLSHLPEERPSAQQLLDHPFLRREDNAELDAQAHHVSSGLWSVIQEKDQEIARLRELLRQVGTA